MSNLVDRDFRLLLFSAFAVSIAMTPWINSDSLIIPKLIILFAGAMFFSPRLFSIINLMKSSLFAKIFFIVTFLYVIQLILVLISSEAPFEQQIFGRTGRGLGLITEFSLIIFVITTIKFIKFENIKSIYKFLLLASLISSTYSLAQRFGLDFFDWNTRTNGIIGTLGNPNFQSSFAAISIFPALVYFGFNGKNKFLSILILIPLVSVIYVAQSTQGYIAGILSFFTFLMIYLWYKSKKAFIFILGLFVLFIGLVILGMINKGPLSEILYKVSIQSRGEMLRNSFSVAKDFPLFGVGIDSLGDYYLMYKDQRTVSGINEFADNAHNSIVNYAATGGFPLAILHLAIVILTIIGAINLILKVKNFNKYLAALVSSWISYLAQSMISPATITLLTWNAIILGSIVGLNMKIKITSLKSPNLNPNNNLLAKPLGVFLLFISFLITFPYFNVDKMQQDSARLGDANLAIKSARSFPESTVRYSRIGQALISANLAPQALEIGRAAAQFNPNAASAWGLILVNNLGTKEERNNALAQLQRLDPTNSELRQFVIP